MAKPAAALSEAWTPLHPVRPAGAGHGRRRLAGTPQRRAARRGRLHRPPADHRRRAGHGQDAHAHRAHRPSRAGPRRRAGVRPGHHLHQQGRRRDGRAPGRPRRRAVAARLTIQTFHAFAAQLLRRYGERLGLAADFAIPASGNSARCCGAHGRPASRRPAATLRPSPRPSTACSRPIRPTGVAARRSARPGRGLRRLRSGQVRRQLCSISTTWCCAPCTCWTKHDDVRAQVHARYRWISVDEYQDVN